MHNKYSIKRLAEYEQLTSDEKDQYWDQFIEPYQVVNRPFYLCYDCWKLYVAGDLNIDPYCDWERVETVMGGLDSTRVGWCPVAESDVADDLKELFKEMTRCCEQAKSLGGFTLKLREL